MVGYTGGTTASPTYNTVCAGDGHTEAILIEFDPAEVSYEELLVIFFRDCSASSKGKNQYKSAIWYYSEDHRAQAVENAARLRKNDLQIMEAKPWWNAEDRHQKYYESRAR